MAFSLQFEMAVHGKLEEYERSVAIAHTVAIRTVTSRMKSQGRAQMRRAGLGTRLPNALRSRVVGSNGQDITHRGVDADPTGTVTSNAIIKGRGGIVDLIDLFEYGTVVVPKHGQFLAVATRFAGGRRGKPMGSYSTGTFRLVPVRKGTSANSPVFVAVHKVRKEVWFLLFRSVRLKKRLRLNELYLRLITTFPEILERSWVHELHKLEG